MFSEDSEREKKSVRNIIMWSICLCSARQMYCTVYTYGKCECSTEGKHQNDANVRVLREKETNDFSSEIRRLKRRGETTTTPKLWTKNKDEERKRNIYIILIWTRDTISGSSSRYNNAYYSKIIKIVFFFYLNFHFHKCFYSFAYLSVAAK